MKNISLSEQLTSLTDAQLQKVYKLVEKLYTKNQQFAAQPADKPKQKQTQAKPVKQLKKVVTSKNKQQRSKGGTQTRNLGPVPTGPRKNLFDDLVKKRQIETFDEDVKVDKLLKPTLTPRVRASNMVLAECDICETEKLVNSAAIYTTEDGMVRYRCNNCSIGPGNEEEDD